MLLLLIFIVLLSNVDCRHKQKTSHPAHLAHRESSESREDAKFSVDVTRDYCNNSIQSAPMNIDSDQYNYNFEVGNTIELTCRNGVHGSILQWQDAFGFETGSITSDKNHALRLRIKSDENDNGLVFTCTADEPHGAKKQISIKLQSQTSCREPSEEINEKYIFLKKGEAYTSTCNGTWQPQKAELNGFHTNFKIIESFSEEFIKSNIICISYKNIPDSIFISPGKYKDKRYSRKVTFERVKSKFTFDLKNDKISTTDKKETTPETKDLPTDNRTDNQSSLVAVVGSVLGAIILLLISVLVLIWYKKLRKRDSDDAAQQVIYAEIEEMPSRPPPRREDQPYAKIMGTLVPKSQTQSNEDHLYCIIK